MDKPDDTFGAAFKAEAGKRAAQLLVTAPAALLLNWLFDIDEIVRSLL